MSYEGSTNAKCPCRTQWLAAGRNASFLGASGGDHKQAWPEAAVEHLKTLIEASKDDGPNDELYADELARKCGFVRDRSSVRKFCEKNLMPLLRSTFPVERKKPEDKYRRWEAASFGEIYQHDSTPRHIWGPSDARQHVILSLDDASRKVTAQRVCERETLLEHFAIVPVAAHPEKRRARLQDRVHGAEMADRADAQEDRVARDTSRKRGLLCP